MVRWMGLIKNQMKFSVSFFAKCFSNMETALVLCRDEGFCSIDYEEFTLSFNLNYKNGG